MSEITLVGAGEQAKAIIAAARKCGLVVRAVYDDEQARWGELLLGVPITGPTSAAHKAGLPVVMGFDDPRERLTFAEQFDLPWQTIVDPTAFLNPSATVGPGTVVLAGAVIQPSVSIGRHVLVAANATVSHDCMVEDYVQIGTGVDLAGGIRIATGARFDVGAVVIPNVYVGAWATIGPRAVVTRDVPDAFHVQGIPARPGSDDDHDSIDHGSGFDAGFLTWLLAAWGIGAAGALQALHACAAKMSARPLVNLQRRVAGSR